MMEKGLPVREAWEEYIRHWDQIHIGMLGMVEAPHPCRDPWEGHRS